MMSMHTIRQNVSPEGLHTFRQGTLPTIFYVPDYISQLDESQILDRIRASKSKWTQLSGRRLQHYGGMVHASCLVQTSMPTWLRSLVDRLQLETDIFGGGPANHVLMNSYMPGEGILVSGDSLIILC